MYLTIIKIFHQQKSHFYLQKYVSDKYLWKNYSTDQILKFNVLISKMETIFLHKNLGDTACGYVRKKNKLRRILENINKLY